jgi:hypothetical protein
MARPGWNTVKLGEHALDGFAVDVGLIHLSQSVHAVMNTIVTVPTLTANTESRSGWRRRGEAGRRVVRIMWAIWRGRSRSVKVSDGPNASQAS